MELPESYSLELVLSEPQIKEPVAIDFDPDGAMYLAEMQTYMQDIDGIDELTPRSLVSKHVSTKGDGKFDKHSVYLENILLPRMILPLDYRILLGATNTLDITVHRDADRDGRADESKVWFTGGPRGGNMEHQPSGLVWGLDNGIYTTYNSYRLRWNGKAGTPLIGVRDFQGGPGKSREDGTLNHFTGCVGQTVFRSDRLPADLIGNVFLPEPVGRLIRRAVAVGKIRAVIRKPASDTHGCPLTFMRPSRRMPERLPSVSSSGRG